MSFDTQITTLTDALSINTAALNAVALLLTESNAGREAAMAAIATATPDKPARVARKPKDEPAATTSTETPLEVAAKLPTADDVRKVLGDWMGETDETVERDKRKDFVKTLIDHFGKRPAELDPEQMQQVLFYLARHRAGSPVDFNAEYDFTGDPTQGAASAEAAPADDDMFG